MSAMVDYPHAAIPHRKPLPTGAGVPPHASHAHSRTASSNVFPAMSSSSAYPSGPAVEQFIQPTRRTLSNATTSTSSSGERQAGQLPYHQLAPVRTPSALRRSGSGRTTTTMQSIQPTSYVALMRKQKATVWSERAQHEDPRLLAAQRQAKMRATMEVVGGSHGGYPRASTASSGAGSSGGLRSKIRHHGATKATPYGANMAGAGVPMRLSANEVEEGDSEDEAGGSAYHKRTGSGRSSLGSERRVVSSQYLAAPGAGGSRDSRYGSASPGSGSGVSPTNLEDDTPVPTAYSHAGTNYFGTVNTHGGVQRLEKTQTGLSHTTSSSSGGSTRENSFGQLAPMAEKQPSEREEAAKRKSTQEDLMRRGSVDERTMTMSGVRLFVANPDDDSD